MYKIKEMFLDILGAVFGILVAIGMLFNDGDDPFIIYDEDEW